MAYPTEDNGKLGLTDDEVIWLRKNQTNSKTAAMLINYYQMVVDAPGDNGARMFFKLELQNWRTRVEQGTKVP